MPWKETSPMDQRKRFIDDFLKYGMSMSDLCRQYEISRKTGYKWLERFKERGFQGLADRSRAPIHHPNAVPAAIVDQVEEMRGRFSYFGPKKLWVKLIERAPEIDWPCPSTIGMILKRKGLVVSRKKRLRVPPYTEPFRGCEGPNDVWCADFKGWFRTADGQRCDPLTISDAHSRFLLLCHGVAKPDFFHVQPLFEATFREFGLPGAIRTDNGPPFATLGAGGLSRLSIWWIKLGIQVERIEPGKPQQNGRHERMHRTLKQATAHPPCGNLVLQQGAFDRFWEEYNFERPHEALNMQPPGRIYLRSPREFPCRIREMEYPKDFLIRNVRQNGCIKWQGELFLSETLIGERVGLKWINEHELEIYFGPVKLAVLNVDQRKIYKDHARGGGRKQKSSSKEGAKK